MTTGRVLTGVVLSLCLMAGCTSPPAGTTPNDPGFQTQVQAILETAQADDSVAGNQLELLAQAKDAGELSQALARQGLQEFFTCLDGENISYQDSGASGQLDFSRFEYVIHSGENPAKADACYRSHFAYLDQLYQMQPAAVTERSEYTRSKTPLLRECLVEHGYPIATDATFEETMAWVFFADTGQWLNSEPPASPSDVGRVDCVGLLGLNSQDLVFSQRATGRG